MAITRTVSLTKKQDEWLVKNDMSLSGYLQEKINEDMAEDRFENGDDEYEN